ncbi:hypothetical protein TRSC58_04906 [Trypanosoma rangeli SC58]|uniref:MIF4G domain-containing protein n=1 Tax=Trypanosoma rangeli SC58 TaxID=429131 RepID=A0A061IXJ3_TRYRA|nr:hypothetical protein TRSC58_04906 [Trypanosoma rangeli SC58]
MSSTTADVLREREGLRRLNLNPEPQRGAFAARSSGLKFDVKKATALAKRFKNYSAEASEKTILMQLDTVNFGMFLSEAAHGVVQSLGHGTRMKPADAHSLAVVCSEVHQRYREFWPSVLKELKENVDAIVDAAALKAAVERIEEYALATVSTAGEGTAPSAMTVAASGSSAPPSAATKSSLSTSSVKSPVDEFNRLRLVTRVFCEWWLVGLFADAKPVLNLLKLLYKLAEKRAGTPNTPLAVATVLSITVLVVREVGIEILGNENAALPCLFAGSGGGAKGSEGLRELVGRCGVLTTDENTEEERVAMFLLGPVGARLTFNATTKVVGPVEDAAAHQAEEASWARLCEIRNPSAANYSKDAEKRQFIGLVLATAKTGLRAYTQGKNEIEKWWHSLNDQAELRGRNARFNVDEARFRLLQEHVERLFVVCDNLLGMLGFVSPLPIDLSIVEHREEVDAVRISVIQKFRPIVGAETLNRFGNDEQRIFYEYVPELEALSNDALLLSLTAEKANWDLFLRHRASGGATASGTGAATSSFVSALPAVALGAAGGGGDGEDSEEYVMDDEVEIHTTADAVEEGRCQNCTETVTLMKRRQLRLAKLAVPAALFDDYAAVLMLLEELEQCASAAVVDEWCERFVGEALQPLRRSSENVAGAVLFFTNCRMLLTLELRHFSRFRHPEQLPLMARCAAIFHQYFPDVGEYLGAKLEAQWRREYTSAALTRETGISCSTGSDAVLQRRCTATVRYLCELMKFGGIPPSRVLNVLNVAIEELKRPCSAATIAGVIEHGGLFLVRNHLTRRTAEKLIKKLKSAMQEEAVSEECSRTITKAFTFLQSAPPADVVSCRVAPEEQTPLAKYVQYLLHHVLSTASYNFVRRELLKMPWNEAESREMLIRALRGAHQVSWDAIPFLTDFLAVLSQADCIQVVQRILHEIAEDMRRDLEVGGTVTRHGHDGVTNRRMTSGAHLPYRPLQWRLVDCFYVANFYRVRLVSFRFVVHVLLLLLQYFPLATPHCNDYSRLQCSITLLWECLPYLPWPLSTSALTGKRSRALRAMEHLDSLHQLLRKLMALVFLHRFSLPEPLPLQLKLRLKELVEELDSNLHRDAAQREGWERLCKQEKSEEVELKKQTTEGPEESGLERKGASSQMLRFPETMAEAETYAKAVAEETVLPANAWYEKAYKAFQDCQADGPFFRLFPIGDQDEPLIRTPESAHTHNADMEDTIPALMDLLPEELEHADEVSTESDSDTVEDENFTHQVTNRRSCSSVGSISSSSSYYYESASGRDSKDENVATPPTFSASLSEVTSTDEEEEGEEEEESEAEEEEESETEEEEEEYNEFEESGIFAAAETLRLRLEEADLDGELRKLMSENPREAMGTAVAYAVARSIPTERLMEQDLSMGMRMHRQQRHHCTQKGPLASELESQKEEPVQAMHFTLLRRPPPNSSTAGKSGSVGVAAVSTASTPHTTAVASANVMRGSNVAVLSVPCGAEFARNALVSQEHYRRQQEELREITRRINRMQEEETSAHALKPRVSR